MTRMADRRPSAVRRDAGRLEPRVARARGRSRASSPRPPLDAPASDVELGEVVDVEPCPGRLDAQSRARRASSNSAARRRRAVRRRGRASPAYVPDVRDASARARAPSGQAPAARPSASSSSAGRSSSGRTSRPRDRRRALTRSSAASSGPTGLEVSPRAAADAPSSMPARRRSRARPRRIAAYSSASSAGGRSSRAVGDGPPVQLERLAPARDRARRPRPGSGRPVGLGAQARPLEVDRGMDLGRAHERGAELAGPGVQPPELAPAARCRTARRAGAGGGSRRSPRRRSRTGTGSLRRRAPGAARRARRPGGP